MCPPTYDPDNYSISSTQEAVQLGLNYLKKPAIGSLSKNVAWDKSKTAEGKNS